LARIRTIKPEIWTDEKFVELSPFARLLFIGLWNFADDEGRMEFRPKRLKLQILPADDLDISALLGEIRRENLVSIYVVDGKEFLSVNGFTKHQKVDKRTASKFPPPPISPGSPPDYPGSRPNFPEPAPDPAKPPRIAPTEGKGLERKGKELPSGDAGSVEKEVFDLGREVLGRKSGGLVTKLRKARALDERPGVILNVSKQRNGDWEGKCGLWFDMETYQYRSSRDHHAGLCQYVTLRTEQHENRD